jgi:hypothetical protein
MLPISVDSDHLAKRRRDRNHRLRLHMSLRRNLQDRCLRKERGSPTTTHGRFQPGNRVYMATGSRHPDFRPSDVATVSLILHRSTRGLPLYYVRRDRDGRFGIVYEDEVKRAC